MNPVEIIIRKRNGGAIPAEDIRRFIAAYLEDEIADYQMSAFLMAVFHKGMTFEETSGLTRAMIKSGETYDWSAFAPHPVDKHSTGGVGDKVSLALAPLAAACGVVVPMVSGRGLGHTGGTLDKLQSIPGFRINLTPDEIRAQLKSLGVVMIGQSDKFVPADKRLYALRDVTGTVECVPLICASILSKKVASGAKSIVMDVKTGTGAFMATQEHAIELADTLIGVGLELGVTVEAMLTDMSVPLGNTIGNSIEMREAIDCLRGEGPEDLRTLVVEQAASMIRLAGNTGHADPLAAATEALDSGRAYERFVQMVEAQGGDTSVVDDPGRLDIAPATEVLSAPRGGFLTVPNCRALGLAAGALGAGRQNIHDTVDPGVGLLIHARRGNELAEGDPIATIIHRNGRGVDEARQLLAEAFSIADEPPPSLPLILRRRPE